MLRQYYRLKKHHSTALETQGIILIERVLRKMVKLYALSTCPWCKKTKKLLDEKGVNYEVVELDLLQGEEQKEALEQVDRLTSNRSFPLLVIGETVIQGYKEEEVREALENEK